MDFNKYLNDSIANIDTYNLDVVLDILQIPNKESTIIEKCTLIKQTISDHYPKLQSFITFLESKLNTELDICKHLIVILYNMFEQPSIFKYPISKKTYKKYIKKKQNNTIRSKQLKLLDDMLYIKFCRCIKKIYTNNLKKHIFNDLQSDSNPYAICTSSIYKNRGFDPPPSAALNCRKTFGWYLN
jgi:hypothetical protein